MAAEPQVGEYEYAVLERDEGILTVRLHTDGGPFRWNYLAQRELGRMFGDIADDSDNRIIILTGTGDEFIGPVADPTNSLIQRGPIDSKELDRLRKGDMVLLANLLRIEVPVIAAVNGPTSRHAEIPLLSDIVVVSDNASFQDSSHFLGDAPPGDGQHVLMPLLMGLNRARYYLLRGQVIPAQQALDWGLVSEVVPSHLLIARAQELARELAQRSDLTLRMTRRILTKQLRDSMQSLLEYGLMLQGASLSQ